MEENTALIEKLLTEEEDTNNRNHHQHHHKNPNPDNSGGWQTVVYPKRHKKTLKPQSEGFKHDLRSNGGDVFRSLELHAEERRRKVLEAQIAADADSGKKHSDNDDEDSDGEAPGAPVENGGTEVKKVKVKKPKKPKVTIAEAAAAINAGDLSAFLADISASYEAQQDIQLMRFADYFGRAFSQVSAAQFPWVKIFKESTVAKLVDVPVAQISEDVYKTSVDWINQKSTEALKSFILWSLDSILADLASHLGTAKGSKKVAQQVSSKSQVAIFVVLAMVLRRKPDVLTGLVPLIASNSKYLGQDKLPVTVWAISQAAQGDFVVGLYMWIHALLPMMSGKSSNPQSRDLLLQLVERILSSPKARPVLLNGASRKGDRLVSPSALDILMRVTFPAPSNRVKATERFEAIYPTLKEIALAGPSGSKAIKQVALQISNFAIKAAGEGVPDLSKEAANVFIWCLTQNPETYRQWEKIYLDNLEASVLILRKLSDEWKVHSIKHTNLDVPRATLKLFRQKNENALAMGDDAARHALLKDADKYCKAVLGRLSKGNGCLKIMFFMAILAIIAAVMSQNVQSSDWKKLSEFLDWKKLSEAFDDAIKI